MPSSPAFTAYAVTTVALCFNLMVLWGWSGGTRVVSKTAINPEDLSTVSKGAVRVTADPDSVARVIRAFNNAAANNIPFLLLASVYVQLGPNINLVYGLFAAFTAFRYLHSAVYLLELQPWRTLSFALGVVINGVMMVDALRLIIMG